MAAEALGPPHDADAGPAQATGELSFRRERRLWWAIGLNLVIVLAQVAFGFVAHSLGLLADAGHNLTDVAALAASLIAVRIARRAPTEKHTFGFYRGTILAAQFNAAMILILTVWLVYESVRRILEPQAVDGGVVVVVALVAMLVNAAAALLLREDHGPTHGSAADLVPGRSDLNIRSAVLHLVADAAASAGVAVAGAIMFIAGGLYWLDPVVSILISVLIAWQAWRLLRSATAVLLEGTPAGLDVASLASSIAEVHGVESVHDLHVWSLSSEVRALSAHVVLSGHPTLEEAQEVGAAVKEGIRAPFRIAHATLELECESCESNGAPCEFEGLTVNVTRRRA